jgi:hypothetical protein
MICGSRHPHPSILLQCELELGHKGCHRSSTVALGEYVQWDIAAQGLNESIADLMNKLPAGRWWCNGCSQLVGPSGHRCMGRARGRR